MKRTVTASLVGLCMAEPRQAAPTPTRTEAADAAPAVPSEQGRADAGPRRAGDLLDPRLHADESHADGTPKHRTERFTGPLFVDGVHPKDVRQGQLGDCYFLAAVASIAATQPEAIQNAVKDNGDGTYTVTFMERDRAGPAYVAKRVTVDGDLAVRPFGGPLYARARGSNAATAMELWGPILEKAYAASFPGGYDSIGDGGSAAAVLEAILGRPSVELVIHSGAAADAVWAHVKAALDNRLPVTAGTLSNGDERRFDNTGILSDHSYSVLGYDERDGVKRLLLRNPWGKYEPWPGDGINDGVFFLRLEDFMTLFSIVSTVR